LTWPIAGAISLERSHSICNHTQRRYPYHNAANAAAKVADLILIPLQPSLIDLKTLGATLDVIRLAGNKPTRAILARVRAAGTRHEESVAWLAGQGIEVCPAMLGERVVYQDAYAQGLSVGEAEPAGKAADEIKQVYLYVSSLLGLSMIRRNDDKEIRSAGERVAQ
jgi:chromosome partitioning protein